MSLLLISVIYKKITIHNIMNQILAEEDFICPITQQYFKNPVICSDGQHYERSAIEEWFKNNNTSPCMGTVT